MRIKPLKTMSLRYGNPPELRGTDYYTHRDRQNNTILKLYESGAIMRGEEGEPETAELSKRVMLEIERVDAKEEDRELLEGLTGEDFKSVLFPEFGSAPFEGEWYTTVLSPQKFKIEELDRHIKIIVRIKAVRKFRNVRV